MFQFRRAMTLLVLMPFFGNGSRILGDDGLETDVLELMQASDLTMGPNPPTICMVDTGIDLNVFPGSSNIQGVDNANPERFWSEEPWLWNQDVHGHGTALAQILLSTGDVPLYITRGLDDNGKSYGIDVKHAIQQCLEHTETKIILLALGDPYQPGFQIDMEGYLKEVEESGIMLIAAAGDIPSSGIYYPAKFESVMAVGGVDPNGESITNPDGTTLASGPEMELVAFLAETSSLQSDTDTIEEDPEIFAEIHSGTGLAAAHVASASALVWSHFHECQGGQIRQALTQTATNALDRNPQIGFGLPQVETAYQALLAFGCDLEGYAPNKGQDLGVFVNPGNATTSEGEPTHYSCGYTGSYFKTGLVILMGVVVLTATAFFLGGAIRRRWNPSTAEDTGSVATEILEDDFDLKGGDDDVSSHAASTHVGDDE